MACMVRMVIVEILKDTRARENTLYMILVPPFFIRTNWEEIIQQKAHRKTQKVQKRMLRRKGTVFGKPAF